MKRLEENQIDEFEFIQLLSYKLLPVPLYLFY